MGGLTSTSRKRLLGCLSTEEMERRLVSFPNVYAGKSRLVPAKIIKLVVNSILQARGWDTLLPLCLPSRAGNKFSGGHTLMKPCKLLQPGAQGCNVFSQRVHERPPFQPRSQKMQFQEHFILSSSWKSKKATASPVKLLSCFFVVFFFFLMLEKMLHLKLTMCSL